MCMYVYHIYICVHETCPMGMIHMCGQNLVICILYVYVHISYICTRVHETCPMGMMHVCETGPI